MALTEVGSAGLQGLLLVLLFAVPVSLRAQALVAGRVTEERTSGAVSAADVTLTDGLDQAVGRAITGEDGQFSFAHPGPGTYELSVDRIGYVPTFVIVTLQEMAAEIDVSLTVLPIELEGLGVAAPQRHAAMTLGFEGLPARRRMGFGDFIVREDIERRVPSLTSDLFVDQIFSCMPTIWVDGLLVRPRSRNLTLNEAAPSPHAIEAIEIYKRSSSVPVQYNIDAMCGVILIWTRR